MSAGAVDIATLGLEIRSDGVVVAADRLKKLEQEGGNAERATKKLADSFDPLTNYIKAAAAALGLFKLFDMAKDAALLAARYDTLGVVMGVVGNNAGYTSKQMKELQADLQKQGIAAVEARQTLVQMAQAHIDLSKSTDLARIAQDAAVIGQINSSEAFERMISGIQRGEVEVLKTIGINVNFESSYKKLAQQLGKNSDQLTENEKVQARLNSVMEKGKDIAGVYEAAMGTAGKQLTSMQRYMDNLKVTLGGVFNDLLIVSVSKFTDGLKEANKQSDKLKEEGRLKEWSRNLVLSFAAVADVIRITVNLMGTFTGTTIAGLMQIYKIGEAAWNLVKGDIAGAKGSIKDMMAYGSGWWDDMQKKWGGKSFTESAKSMFAERDKNAVADAAKQEELEKQRLAAAAAAKRAADKKAADDALIAQNRETAKQIIDTEKERIKVLQDLENDHLQKVKQTYSEKLQALKTFAAAADTIMKAMDERDRKEAEAKAAALRGQEDAYSRRIRLTEELISLEAKVDANTDAAERAKLYNELVDKHAELNKEIKSGRDVLITAETAEREYLIAKDRLYQKIYEAIENETEAKTAAAEKDKREIAASEARLEGYTQKVRELSNMLQNIDKNIVISVQIQGVQDLYNVAALTKGISSSSGIKSYGDYYTQNGGVYWNDGSFAGNASDMPELFPQYATGTQFVKKTGLALVHEGEKITPASQNKGGATFGNVTINVNGVDRNADQIAREIVPALQKYMGRMAV